MRSKLPEMKKESEPTRAGESARSAAEERAYNSSRQRWLNVLLSMICPGLLWTHKGYAWRGMWVNLFFIAALLAYAVIWVWLKFYPVGPTLWFLGGWFVIALMNAWDASRAPNLREISPRSMELGVFAVATWFGPLLVLAAFVSANIASVVTMRSASMFPTALPGDVMLIDRSALFLAWPRPGDIVLYRLPGENLMRMGRVVGLPGDLISFHDGKLIASRYPVSHGAVEEHFAANFSAATGLDPNEVGARFESLGDVVYTVAGTHETQSANAYEGREWKVGERELFLLNDNRGHIDDSRAFGPISVHSLIGMPIYVMRSVAGDAEMRRLRSGTALQEARSVRALQLEMHQNALPVSKELD